MEMARFPYSKIYSNFLTLVKYEGLDVAKIYYEENRETITEEIKELKKNPEYIIYIKAKSKKYYEENKEKIAERQKIYREENKELKRFYCDICEYNAGRKSDLSKHLKTQKHYIAEIIAENAA